MAKVFKSARIDFISGVLKSELPFALQRCGENFMYSRRTLPYQGGRDDSHWRYLKMLAGMCGKDLYFVDMEVSVDELAQALSEMLDCHFLPLQVQKWTGKKVLNVEEFRAFADWLRERGIGE